MTYKVMVLVYKALHDQAPPYIKSLLSHYRPPRTLRLSSKQLLIVPRHNTESYGARAFSVFALREYNKLPESVTSDLTSNVLRPIFLNLPMLTNYNMFY